MDARERIGDLGEAATSALYERRGYRVVARNWRCGIGELDLVALRREVLVFCEVKSRSGARFGGGFDAVTPRKQRKIRSLAEVFLAASSIRHRSIRFDVASVRVDGPRGSPTIELFEDAF